MPSSGKTTVLKLDNGYNLGIANQHIKRMERLETRQDKQSTSSPDVHQDNKLPYISILHTGGTIASKVDYAIGGVSAKFSPEDLLSLFPELGKHARIKSRLIANMLSENMNLSHYNLIAAAVEEEIKQGAQGIVITHGTDTLHYTSAALAFLLENLPVPVILVGAQRSSDRGSSDAGSNLVSAVAFAAQGSYTGVAICMHATQDDTTCLILHPLKARKMHTSRRDAFRPINTKPLASIDIAKRHITRISPFPKHQKGFKRHAFKTGLRISMVYAHPGMRPEELPAPKETDGVILIGTGLGHLPIQRMDEHTDQNLSIKDSLADLAKHVPVVMASQCLYGRVDMQVYSGGRELLDLGVWGDQLDFTPETAFIKLAFVLSNHAGKEAKDWFHKDIRGEITSRIEKDTYLI